MLVSGGETAKRLTIDFLIDLQEYWHEDGKEVLRAVGKKYPAQMFAGMIAVSKLIRLEPSEQRTLDRSASAEQIIDQLEQRVGPKGRALFERFLREVNKLQAEQQAELQTEGGKD